jgi:ABC-type nitrate/sulfonate/bicarbonate transport system substrate-binding protein
MQAWSHSLVSFCRAVLVAGAVSLATTPAIPSEAIRLGWQIPWAVQGQLVMALQRTNLQELNGVVLEPVGFAYGAPLNQAALSGQLDMVFTADQPALVLLSNSDNFAIVARLMYNRTCIYVPPSSDIKQLSDLNGKRVMGPVGAAAERVALAAIAKAGVPVAGLQRGNLDMAAQTALLKRHGVNAREWAGTDALYGFDPLPAKFEIDGWARLIACGRVTSLVLASRDMVGRRNSDLRQFLRAYAMGWAYYRRNPAVLNKWFLEVSRLDMTDGVLNTVAAVEPNLSVRALSEIRLTLNDADLSTLDATLQFLVAERILKDNFDFRRRIALESVRSATEGLDWDGELAKVRAVR